MVEVPQSIEVHVRWIENDLEIKPPTQFNLESMNKEAARKTRSVIAYWFTYAITESRNSF